MLIDLALEQQVVRCKLAVEEYFREKMVEVDRRALYRKLEPAPLLFQFAHMIAYLKIDWKDALRWVLENKNAIMVHSEVNLNEQQESSATAEADGEANRASPISAHKG